MAKAKTTLREQFKRHVKRCTFRGRDWRFEWHKPRARRSKATQGKPNLRMAEVNWRKGTIVVDPMHSPKTLMANVIHEGLHACLPDLCERTVGETSNSITEALLRMGAVVSFEPWRSTEAKLAGWQQCDPYYKED